MEKYPLESGLLFKYDGFYVLKKGRACQHGFGKDRLASILAPPSRLM